MNESDFINVQKKLKKVVPTLLEMRLPEFKVELDRAATLGPFFAPTAFLKAADDLALDIRCAAILLEAQQKLRELYPAAAIIVDTSRAGADLELADVADKDE